MMWALAVLAFISSSLLIPGYAGASNDGASSVIQLDVIHAFSTQSDVLATDIIDKEQGTISARSPELVVITAPMDPKTLSASSNGTFAANSPFPSMYSFAAAGRVAIQLNGWKLVHDSTYNSSSWTQFERVTASNVSFRVCVAIVSIETESSVEIIRITDRLNTFCAEQDLIILGVTATLSNEYARYLEAKEVINGKYVPRTMQEIHQLARPAQDRKVSAQEGANRLFMASPRNLCTKSGDMASLEANAVIFQSLKLSIEGKSMSCSDAHSSADAEFDDDSTRKRGLVVLLSCGSFLLGSAAVFYILFRKQFFTPSEASKPEKELTTHLAYVLRM